MLRQELQELPEVTGVSLGGMRRDAPLAGEVYNPGIGFGCQVRRGGKC